MGKLIQAMHALQSDINMIREATQDGKEAPEDEADSEESAEVETSTVPEVTKAELSKNIEELASQLVVVSKQMKSHAPGTGGLEGDRPENKHVARWVMCKGSSFQPSDPDDAAYDVKTRNAMDCTAQFTFVDLCCIDFEALAFDHPADIVPAATLPKADEDVVLAGVGGDQAAEVIGALCTIKQKLTISGDRSTVQSPMECLKQEMTIAEVTNATVVLTSRIIWLMEQGMPPESIPTCKEEIGKTGGKCGEGTQLSGKSPNSASDMVLAKLMQARSDNVAMAEADLAEYVNTLIRISGVNVRRGGGGFLSTQGSFSLSSGSGNNVGGGG